MGNTKLVDTIKELSIKQAIRDLKKISTDILLDIADVDDTANLNLTNLTQDKIEDAIGYLQLLLEDIRENS
jgi:hypothetical protein